MKKRKDFIKNEIFENLEKGDLMRRYSMSDLLNGCYYVYNYGTPRSTNCTKLIGQLTILKYQHSTNYAILLA